MSPIQSWGDLAIPVEEDSIPIIDPPQELDEDWVPGLVEIWDLPEEWEIPAEPSSSPAPILETAAETIPAALPLELLLLPPSASQGEAAADVSPPSHCEENP